MFTRSPRKGRTAPPTPPNLVRWCPAVVQVRPPLPFFSPRGESQATTRAVLRRPLGVASAPHATPGREPTAEHCL